MTDQQNSSDADPMAAAARVDREDRDRTVQAKMAEALRVEHDWAIWRIRMAAVLNFVDIAKNQGGHRDWTDVHAKQIMDMMAIGNSVLVGDEAAIVPSGFGDPVRVQQSRALLEALEKIEKAGETFREKMPEALNAATLMEGPDI